MSSLNSGKTSAVPYRRFVAKAAEVAHIIYTMVSALQLDSCRMIYRDVLAVDESGTANDVDSLNIVNVIVGVAKILGLDLYDLLDSMSEEDFFSESVFLEKLENVVPALVSP